MFFSFVYGTHVSHTINMEYTLSPQPIPKRIIRIPKPININHLPIDVLLLLPLSFACTRKNYYHAIPNHDIDWICYYVDNGKPSQVLIMSKWEYIIHSRKGWITFVHEHKKRLGKIIITNVTKETIGTCETLALNYFQI